MSKVNYSAKIIDDSKLEIGSMSEPVLTLDITQDIDFTGLVQVLSTKIDSGNEIALSIEDENSIVDGKQFVIIDTLKAIFEKFNNVIQSDAEQFEERGEDTDLPF